jgi:hypothetical protein
MQPNNIIDSQAEMAYRATYLTEQFQHPTARSHRDSRATHRIRPHLRWLHRSNTD